MKNKTGFLLWVRLAAWGVLAVLLSGLVYVSSALAGSGGETLLYAQDFESGRPGEWEFGPGWEVVEHEGGHVLAGQGHEWAAPNIGPWSDYRLRFKIKLTGGASLHANVRQAAQLRYFVGLNRDGLYLAKQTGPETFAENLARAPGLGGDWTTVEIAVYGPTIAVSLDGREVMTYTDPDPLVAGGMAFESLDDAPALIDDIEIWGPAPTPTPTMVGGTSWIRTGGPLGGLGYDVRMDPRDPDVMYVTDAWAGVFKSIDGGQTWFPSNQGITTRAGESGDAIPVFSLTIDPNNPDVIWVGTQNTRGIFKSTDGGATWVEMDRGVVEYDGITFRGFAVDPVNSDVVYAAAEISSWAWAGEPQQGGEFDLTKGVVYKTTDGGARWQAVWRGDNLARYIWIDPRDPNVIYVSTGIFDREAANSDPQAGSPGGEGVLKSTDGGQTWERINNGLGNLYVGTLFMHPENPDILLAGTGNNQYHAQAGVYLTTDGGQSWTQTLRSEPIESIEFSTADPNIAYAGSADGFYVSRNGGRTWQSVAADQWGSPGVRVGFPIDLQADPRDPDHIFANAYGGGNFLSVDGGRTWVEASKGYTGAQVRAIAVNPSQPGEVYAAARSGIFVSYDGGGNWEGIAYPPARVMEWNAAALDPEDPAHILAANNWNTDILFSDDGGRSWTLTVTRLPKGVRAGWSVIAFAPSDPQTVYAAAAGFYSAGSFDPRMPGAGLYASHDGGETWQAVNTDLTNDASVRGLAVDPHDAARLFAASTNKGILRTLDGGETWEQAGQGAPAQGAFSIAMHPEDPQILLAGFGRSGLYRSQDGGQTWEQSGSGLPPEASVTSIVFDPSNPQAAYAADSHSGVYRSLDDGRTWTPLNEGLATRAVSALAISSDGQHLYAATDGDGVYRLDLNGQPPEPASPSGQPEETEPTDTPTDKEPSSPPATGDGGGGLPCAGGALPLALVGLIWARRRRAGRKRDGRQ